MKTKSPLQIILSVIIGLGMPLTASAAPKKSTQQIRQMQQKEFTSACSQAFKAAISALQDNNFQVKEADTKAGFIFAKTGEKHSTLWGTSKQVVSSLTFEDAAAQSCLVRTNFFEVASQKSMGLMSVLMAGVSVGLGGGISPNSLSASGWEQAKLVVKPQIYQNYYTQVEKHLFVKKALER